MGLTITEKVLKKSVVEGKLVRGQEIGIQAHQTLGHDLNAVMSFLALQQMGVEHVKTEISVQYVDHNMIQADYKNADDHRFLEDITSKTGVIYARPGSGICHQLHLEYFGQPGKTLVGGDSHTVAAGGLGMFSIGVGGFDAALSMAGEPLYITMPEIVNIRLTGRLPHLVSAKNIILEVLRRISVKGGVGKVLEYTGPGVKHLNVAERSTITNMGAETGATSSIFPSDKETKKWLHAFHREEQWTPINADEDAYYDEVIEIDLSQLEPLIALPSQPDKVVPVREVAGTKIDQVMLGSCTNTALNDVLALSKIFENQKVATGVDAALYPSTRTVIKESMARGAFDSLVDAGIRIFEPICGGCNGCGFAPPTDGVSIRTTPRNFEGRSGTKPDHVYLAAPETAAVSAITGVITDPRDFEISNLKFEVPESFQKPKNLFIYPSEHPQDVEIHYGPNLKKLPEMKELEDNVKKEVLLKLSDNVTTDHICPAGALYLPIRSNIPEISKYAFHVVDDHFYERVQAADGGVIVAGENYGQGSSREQAAVVPRYLGIKAVIAKSFARLHLANMVNWGLLPLIFDCSEDYSKINEGDQLEIETIKMTEGKSLKIYNTTQNYNFTATSPVSQKDLNNIKIGGKINSVKKKERQ